MAESFTRLFGSVSLASLLLTSAPDVQATVLPFSEPDGGQARVAAGYGSRISAVEQEGFTYAQGNGFTPHIALQHRTIGPGGDSSRQMNAYLGWGAQTYGSLAGVAYPYNGQGTGEIVFIPDDGWSVRINSFKVASWRGVGANPATLRLLDGDGGVLWDVGPFAFPDSDWALVTPDLTHDGVLRLQYGDSWFVALDDLDFDQVPEPASVLLVGAGGIFLCRRSRCGSR